MQENININGQLPSNGVTPLQIRQENPLDLRKMIDKFLRYWYWFLLAVAAMMTLAWLYLRYTTPDYKIIAKILVQDEKKGGQIPGEEVLDQLEMFNSKSSVDNEMEVLKSRSLMEQTVRRLQLNVSYFREGRVKTTEQYNDLPITAHWETLKDSINSVVYQIQPVEAPEKFTISMEGGSFNRTCNWGDTLQLPEGVLRVTRNAERPLSSDGYYINVLSMDEAVAAYQKQLDISLPSDRVSIVDLTLISPIPEKGEKVLNELISTYMRNSIEDKNKIADSTIAFIDNRLVIVSRELSGVEKDIQQFKQSNELTDLSAQSQLLLQNTSDYAKQVADAQVKLSVIASLQEYINDDKNNRRIVPASIVVQDATFSSLVEKYNTLQLERERQLLASTESNPLVRNIDTQLAGLRTDIANNLASYKKGLEVSLQGLQLNAADINQQVRQVPAKERVFLDYSRQQLLKQELYLFLLKKREESAISKSSNMAIGKTIDPAKSDPKPFQPKNLLIYAVALVLGVLIPAGILYLKDLLNRRVLHKDDISAQTPVPILAEIGHSEDKDVLVEHDSRSPVAEQFRALRTNLQFILSGERNKVILLTSSMSGEGKSFVATNLAAVLALSGKKVVLLEMDLRKPKISEKLGVDNHTGFSTYAIGKSSLDSVIKPSGINDLCWLIPSGPIPPNPTELLLLEQTERMFNELRQEFDYIIIDTAPIGLVTDAQLLGRYADATLYLVRQGYTFKQQMLLTKELYQQRKMPKINLVVNDVKSGGSYYGYGYGYGGYAYGNGYVVDEKPRRALFRRRKTVSRR